MKFMLKAAPLLAALWVNVHATEWKAPAAAAAKPVPGQSDGKVLMGYYPNWSHYAGFTADKIPYEYLTHILYAFYITDGAGNIKNSDPLDADNFKNLVKLAHAKNVKVMLSIGGAAQSAPFKPMSASPGSRANFIKNCIKVADEMQLDGIDLDWEYPLEGDSLNQLALHREIRAAFDKLPRKLLFSAAVPVVDYWAHWSAAETWKLLDYVNCMTYDYMGTWEKAVIPNSGMDQSDSTMKYFLRRGVPPEKLVMGAAFYGKSFDGGTAMNGAFNNIGSGNNGNWMWKDLLVQFNQVPYKIMWDDKTGSEFAVGNEEIIVFNGLPSQRVRGEYIRNSKFGGVMYWDMLSDVPDRDKSLLVALYRGLRGTNKGPLATPPAK
jgi:chitinase